MINSKSRVMVVGADGSYGKALVRSLQDQFSVIRVDYAPRPWLVDDNHGVGGNGGCDATKYRDVLELCQALRGPLDGLVYLPRARFRGSFDEFTLEHLINEMEVTVGGLLHFVQAINSLRSAPFKPVVRIVAVSSVLARSVSMFEGVGYHLSKAALEQLVRVLGLRLGSRGIRVNALALGWMLADDQNLDDLPKELSDPLRRIHPLGKPVTNSQVTGLVSYLLSEASDGMTGQILTLDGGCSNIETSFAAIGPAGALLRGK